MTAAGWCPFATRVDIPAVNYATGHEETLAVCLHIMNSSLASCISWFKNPVSRVSAHFGIGKDGSLTQFVGIHDTAYAQGIAYNRGNGRWFTSRDNRIVYVRPTWELLKVGMSVNRHIVSIEHEGKPGEPLTPAMTATQTRLLHWLAEQTRLVYVVGRTLIGHFNLDDVGRAYCPGPAFDFAEIAMAANGEPDWATAWGDRAPYNPGFGIATAWRDSWRLGKPLGKALCDELPAAGFTVQPFERGYITFSAAAGITVKEW